MLTRTESRRLTNRMARTSGGRFELCPKCGKETARQVGGVQANGSRTIRCSRDVCLHEETIARPRSSQDRYFDYSLRCAKEGVERLTFGAWLEAERAKGDS